MQSGSSTWSQSMLLPKWKIPKWIFLASDMGWDGVATAQEIVERPTPFLTWHFASQLGGGYPNEQSPPQSRANRWIHTDRSYNLQHATHCNQYFVHIFCGAYSKILLTKVFKDSHNKHIFRFSWQTYFKIFLTKIF